MKIATYNWGHLGGSKANFGDKLMLETLIYYLSSFAKFSEINVFSTDILYTKNRLSMFLVTRDVNLKVHKFPLINPYFIMKAIQIIKNSNLLIVGGGEIIYDESSWIYSLLNLYPCLINKSILFGVGASEENYSKTTKIILNHIKKSKNVACIFARDKKSVDSFSKLFNGCFVYTGTDVAFTHPILINHSNTNTPKENNVVVIPRLHFAKSKIGIVNFLPFKIRRYLSGRKEFEMTKIKYFDFVTKILQRLIKEENIKNVTIVPFSTKIGIDHEISSELKAHLVKKFQNVKVIITHTQEVEDVVKILDSASFSIPSTYHGVITSAICSTRIFATSYSNKVNELCKTLSVKYIDMRKPEDIELIFLLSNKNAIEKQKELAKAQFRELYNKILEIYYDEKN